MDSTYVQPGLRVLIKSSGLRGAVLTCLRGQDAYVVRLEYDGSSVTCKLEDLEVAPPIFGWDPKHPPPRPKPLAGESGRRIDLGE